MDVWQLRRLVTASKRLLFTEPKSRESFGGRFARPILIATSLIGSYGNILSLLEPLQRGGHTIKALFYADKRKVRRINFDPPELALDIEDGFKYLDGFRPSSTALQDQPNWSPSTKAKPTQRHVLVFETNITSFFIGKTVQYNGDNSDDQTGLFAIEDCDGKTIGDIVTTFGEARSSSRARDFLAISWGFSLKFAPVHESYVPRWRFDGEGCQSDDNKAAREALGSLNATTGAKGFDATRVARFVQEVVDPYVPGRWFSGTSHITGQQRHAVDGIPGELYDELANAVEGEPMPRALWPLVNVILVVWEGEFARRVGVGKVIMRAWQEQKSSRREVILAKEIPV